MSNRIWNMFKELTDIYSPSFGEREFCDALCNRLEELGIAFQEDDVAAAIGGNCGNLYGYLPGEQSGSPLLFSAHMDTVEPAMGKEAILHENGRIESKGNTILGADDVAGIVIILEAIARLKEQKIPHRPIELLFPVAEERYGAGSSAVDYSRIKAKEAYVLDLSGAIGEAANAAPTLMSFEINIQGKAAHAGFAPEKGVHAIMVAAKAICQLPQGRPTEELTFNIALIEGGEATNIVPALCTIKGEIRSLNHQAVLSHWEKVQAVFAAEAQAVGAAMEAKSTIHITAYQTPLDSPVVKRFERACKRAGVPSNIHSTLGGSDHNNFALHGITGLVLACSMHEVHSAREHSSLQEIETCVGLVMELMTDKEDEQG